MALLSDERMALLVSATSRCAQQYILFDRDETDSYRLQLEAVRSDLRQLTRDEVMEALPVGSRWANAIGWESYVVVPIQEVAGEDIVIVGLQFVLPHPRREAYPIFAGVVVPLAKAPESLGKISHVLDPEEEKEAPSYGIVLSKSRSTVEHWPVAAAILRSAALALANGRRVVVRTVVLTEDELRRTRSDRRLLGIVPGIAVRFSLKTKLALFFEKGI